MIYITFYFYDNVLNTVVLKTLFLNKCNVLLEKTGVNPLIFFFRRMYRLANKKFNMTKNNWFLRF